jgi:UDP-N-acetylmuramate dehydrogenase
VHDRQALVLVHRGGGSGKELLELSREIARQVLDRYGVELEREVGVIDISE